jgi:SAM-dependent methyltransferase
MTDPARAVIFGRDAASYERHRPDYPSEAVDHIRHLVEATSAVEVGAGTGKATVAFARPDLELVCLEPSPGMAEMLRQKGLPGVEVVESTFEEWDGPHHSFDLIYAAQAWHWVDPAAGFEKAHLLLRPGGSIALMWNVPVDRYGKFEHVYRRHAPELLAERDDRILNRDRVTWLEDLDKAGFSDVERFTHSWSASLTGADTRALYSTYSDHMLLPEPGRSELLDALEETVEEQGGAEIRYRTEVFSGRSGSDV